MKRTTITIAAAAIALALQAAAPADTALWREPYRPQYHFTPAHRWIGDPCGNIRHAGRYMAYSWGAAASTDLVHWTELNDHAIKGVPDGIATFTGSVVADTAGTAGFGRDALVAVFTSFDEATKKQSQSIAFSHDGGVTFQYYDQNPVLDIWSTEFRDPTVMWDSVGSQWLMLVARALEKKVAFYGSPDLKHWTWLSDFGPMGDSDRSWECPDMFPLAVEGSDTTRMVMVVSVNWAREQYFTGRWDGRQFTADRPESYPRYVDHGMDYYASRTFAGCAPDSIVSIGWVNTWDYAVQAPSTWGKGVWSVPRRLSLVAMADSTLHLRQQPVEALASLRGNPVAQLRTTLRRGITPLRGIDRAANAYDLELTIDCARPDRVGLNLCEGEGCRVGVTYDTATGYLTIDRTRSTDEPLPRFDRITATRVPAIDGKLKLRALVDRSTVEIFANDGLTTFTLLTYAPARATGASLTSLAGTTPVTLTAHPLAPIH